MNKYFVSWTEKTTSTTRYSAFIEAEDEGEIEKILSFSNPRIYDSYESDKSLLDFNINTILKMN